MSKWLLQVAGGGMIGYYGEEYGVLSPDFSVGNTFIDEGIQAGSYLHWVIREVIKMNQQKKNDEK